MEASKRKENVEAAAAPAIPPNPAPLSRASSADEQGRGLPRAALAAVDGDASLAGSAAGGGGGGGARTIHVRTLPVTGLRVIDPVVRRPDEFAGIKSDLDEFGFAVVGGVLTEAERTALDALKEGIVERTWIGFEDDVSDDRYIVLHFHVGDEVYILWAADPFVDPAGHDME